MKSGYVSIVGRPNVGKSTLLNYFIGQKISITSRKPQTTRHTILGIKTTEQAQVIFVDTPGMHSDNKNQMNQIMNRSANQSLDDVDIVLFLVEANRWTEQDELIANKLKSVNVPVFLVINKTDLIQTKSDLLPYIEKISQEFSFQEIISVSAKTGKQTDDLENCIEKYLQDGELIYPEDQITDRSERFIASEIIREKLTRTLGQELPYALTVEIEDYKENEKLIDIAAIIWVERSGQKSIVIGKKGSILKNIGQQARIELEKLCGKKVFLQLWVKVKAGWSDDLRALRSLGYTNE